ncbi:LigA [Desulfarculus baarsii DSM 2075]|uniref:Peptide chain release factor 2 n=2 Tax=Desulfarculus baarsii TaxID=453230 RepID=E1QIJ8_DESB2|nr:peptide chain release factor 2 [Desulfarculus baarsii]ADK84421.1 LigA [Desulfarculus baarsii DSM 2075]
MRQKLAELRQRLGVIQEYLDPESKTKRLAELDKIVGANDFWEDQNAAKAVMRERTDLAQSLEELDALNRSMEDAEVLLELAVEEDDASLTAEIDQAHDALERQIGRLEAARLLGGPDDHRGAILAINAGAGGADAQDWAQMLTRLYGRYAERQGFQVVELDFQAGDEAGVKSVTMEINGPRAYGLLKGESGVHRLVRISPFDASHRRHTAFASVYVSPQVDDDIEIEVKDADIRIDTYRASGAGGQHVNKTSSAVRITHFPTGVVVQCQNEKSQHRNKDMAMKVLRARLYELEIHKREAEKREVHASHQEIAWGSQIRSYVLAPYRLVKDHRTGVEVGNVDSVLDGQLDDFIQGYLLWRSGQGGAAKAGHD